MLVNHIRHNRVLKVVKELYEMELPHEVRAEKIGEALDRLKAAGELTREELKQYNDAYGIHKDIDYAGCYVTSIKHPNNESITVTRFPEPDSEGIRGMLTIQGRRAKNEDPFFDLTPETMLQAIRMVRAETFITPYEKDCILDALLEF